MFDGIDKTVRFENNLSPKLIKAEFCNYAPHFHVETQKRKELRKHNNPIFTGRDGVPKFPQL